MALSSKVARVLGSQPTFSQEANYKFQIPHYNYPQDLMKQVLHKRQTNSGQDGIQEDYLLKVAGREEFLLGDFPLSQFEYIRKCIANNEIPSLVLTHKDKAFVTTKPPLPPKPAGQKQRTTPVPSRPSRYERVRGTCIWDMDEQFTIKINGVTNVEEVDYTKLYMRVGIHHGIQTVCNSLNTGDVMVAKKVGMWEEKLTFDIDVKDLPRMSRMCCTLYKTIDKNEKKADGKKKHGTLGGLVVKEGNQELMPIAWANLPMFDYKGDLRIGKTVLYMWHLTDDDNLVDLLNPFGTVESHPKFDESVALTITFDDFNIDGPLFFPPFDRVIEEAAKQPGPTKMMENVTATHLEKLREMIERDPLQILDEQDKEKIWDLRWECQYHFPHSLPRLLQSVKWNDRIVVAMMQSLLQVWKPLNVTHALELLDFTYADKSVRKFAIQCLKDISDSQLIQYLLQLVQVLKYESYLDCELVEFLLHRALNNEKIGHLFFWLLRSEMHVPSVSVRFGLILEAYCRSNARHMMRLSKQRDALDMFHDVTDVLKQDQFKDLNDKKIKDKAHAEMRKLLSSNQAIEKLTDLQSPLDPGYRLNQLRVPKSRFMNSKMRPLWLEWENVDPLGKDVLIMYKWGDDLRQDMLTLQILRIMDGIWQAEGLDLRLNAYQCLSTGHNEGVLQIVEDTKPLADIMKQYNTGLTGAFAKDPFYKWLREKNPDETAFQKALDEFTRSCAGNCVATYILGVADRHSDNILLKSNGQLVHIDFGHILGQFKSKFGVKRERVPFVLVTQFVYVIQRGADKDGKKTYFKEFRSLCEQAYLALRKQANFLITLFMMMKNTGIPEVTMKNIEWLQQTLQPDISEEDAIKHFQGKFNVALNKAYTVGFNWAIHNVAKVN